MWNVIRYDLCVGLKKCYIRYIVLFVMVIITCIHVDGIIYDNIEMRFCHAGFLNYIIYMFQGIRPVSAGELKEYGMPVFWVFYNIYILFVLGGYVSASLKIDRCQCFVRFGSRSRFIIGKYIYMLTGTLLYYICIYSAVICHMFISQNIRWYEPVIGTPVNFFNIQIFPSIRYIIYAFVLTPLLSSSFYVSVCLLAEIYSRLMPGLIVISLYIISGIYDKNIYNISSNTMLCRNEYVMPKGMAVSNSLFIVCVAIAISVIAGIISIRHYEFIRGERNS